MALRQSRQRGYFTYTDLRIASEYLSPAALAEMLTSLSAATLVLAIGYATTIVTILTSALLVSQSLTSTPSQVSKPSSLQLNTTNMQLYNPVNLTLEEIIKSDILEEDLNEKVKCCTKWLTYQEECEPRKIWSEEVVMDNWMTFESWWSKTSVLNWLYQSSLINPMQRWLEKLDDIGQLVKSTIENKEYIQNKAEKCGNDKMSVYCMKQWVNLSKLSALVVSVSDR